MYLYSKLLSCMLAAVMIPEYTATTPTALEAATKPSPLSVTTVPPLTDPDDGHTDSTRAALTYSTCTPLWLSSPPSLLDTSTTCIPAPRVGSAHSTDEDDTTDPIEYTHDEP